MRTTSAVALLLCAHVQAHNFQYRIQQRAAPFANETVASGNASTSAIRTDPPDFQDGPTILTPTVLPITTQSQDGPIVRPTAIDVTVPGQSPTQPAPSPDVPGSRPTAGDASDGNGGDVCANDVVTYMGSVYPTVFVTITEGYEVTLTENEVLTDTETLITPAQACSSTVVPIPNARGGPIATLDVTILVTETSISSETSSTVSSTSSVRPPFPTITGPGNITDGDRNNPNRPPPPASESAEAEEPENSFAAANPSRPPKPEAKPNTTKVATSVVETTIWQDLPYTSTVIVTKKTPIVVSPRQTPETPPNFDPPKPPPPKPDPPRQDGGRPAPGGGSNTNTDANAQVSNPSGGLDVQQNVEPTARPDRPRPQTAVNNIPIAVQSPSVFIGNTAVPIPPAGSSQIVETDGVTFTVEPSAIIAPTTTIEFGPLRPIRTGGISIAPTRVTAAPGVVVDVDGSTAVVAGTTFRLNDNFSTVLTVSGQVISIGPSGVGLPSTTIAAGRVTEAPIIVETVGRVTFTIDGDDVIISGKHFGIATDSPSVTTDFDGETVSIGPGGVGFASTTVPPTTAESRPTITGDGQAEATSSGTDNDEANTASSMRMSVLAVLLSACAALLT